LSGDCALSIPPTESGEAAWQQTEDGGTGVGATTSSLRQTRRHRIGLGSCLLCADSVAKVPKRRALIFSAEADSEVAEEFGARSCDLSCILTRKTRLRLRNWQINESKRLLQQNLPLAEVLALCSETLPALARCILGLKSDSFSDSDPESGVGALVFGVTAASTRGVLLAAES